MEAKICDLCKQDGEFKEAIGWYEANDGDDYDVCKEHAKNVETMGFKLNLYEEE